MASSSHRRSRPDRRPARIPAIAVVAVAAVALVVSLVVAFRPDGGSGGGQDKVAPVAGAPASVSPTATASSASPEPKPSTASPTATASKPAAGKTPSASPTTAPASTRPSAEPTPRTPVAAAAPSAGRIRPGATYKGLATSYDVGNGDGACSYGPTTDVMTAAMNTADYETSKACGAYVLVRAGGKSVTVRITNECPAPCEAGQLDLSQQAFAKLAPLSAGRIPITWSLLSPSTSDTISIRYKTGSTQYWCGIQAIGHRNPLARLEVRTNGGWSALPRTEYNYFLSEQGAGCGDAIRLTDVYGERLTVEGLAVRPDAVQATRVQFARR
ncbi:expansin EXLX1 family cellulose-binding protein [Streptomyces sp. NPDC002888]|uniref:expansin EXLX1 family cellulose-binding protein n=1 Tax=Streptomyces sp. NPDC002888 TaxID=3364668 RepID=UPI0036819CA4